MDDETASNPPAQAHKRRPTTITYLTRYEVIVFFEAVKKPRDVAIFRLAYHRGLRASEIGRLQFSDFRPEEGRLQVTRLKGSSSFDYPLTKIEIKALRSYLRVRGNEPGPLFLSRNGNGISRIRLHELMHHYSELAGIPAAKSHMHVWKHSCGTHLAEDGADLLDIKDHLGHRNVQNTMVYVEITSKRREAFGNRVKDWK
jgi:type 1 fimbriae regulatory protein FimB